MAASQRLPNGYIAVILTPREATSISDELLHPDGFPWQSTENQITALELRDQLRGLVALDAMDRLGEASRTLIAMQEGAEFEEDPNPPPAGGKKHLGADGPVPGRPKPAP